MSVDRFSFKRLDAVEGGSDSCGRFLVVEEHADG
jgi:hypothetical protein